MMTLRTESLYGPKLCRYIVAPFAGHACLASFFPSHVDSLPSIKHGKRYTVSSRSVRTQYTRPRWVPVPNVPPLPPPNRHARREAFRNL